MSATMAPIASGARSDACQSVPEVPASGTANQALAREIGGYLGVPDGPRVIKRFADGELYIQIQESIRGCDVFLIQPTCAPVNDHLMELLIMADALRRASARRITAVIPYFGYARQDRKPGPRTPISAKLVANLLTQAGVDRVLTVDLQLLAQRHVDVKNGLSVPPVIRPPT